MVKTLSYEYYGYCGHKRQGRCGAGPRPEKTQGNDSSPHHLLHPSRTNSPPPVAALLVVKIRNVNKYFLFDEIIQR